MTQGSLAKFFWLPVVSQNRMNISSEYDFYRNSVGKGFGPSLFRERKRKARRTKGAPRYA